MLNSKLCKLHEEVERFIVLMFLFIFSVFQLQAQLVKQEYTYKHYTIHDGLAQMQVMSIYQDSKGYLWFNTKGGLSRFNGKNFKNYTDGFSLPGFDITTMGESDSGNLLLFGALNFGELLADTLYSHSYPNNNRSSSAYQHSTQKKLKVVASPLTDNQHVWKVISYKNLDSIITYPTNNNYGEIIYLDEEKNDLVWQTNFDSIYVSELASMKLMETFGNTQKIEQIVRVGNDVVGVNKNRWVYKLVENQFKLLFKLKSSARYFKMIPTPDGDAIVIKADQDLFYFKDRLIPVKTGFSQIRDLLFDNEGNLWVATEEGLYNFFQLNFVNFTFGKGNKDWVWSVIEDDDKNFWFASYQNGLWKWDGNSTTDYTDLLNSKLKSHLKTQFPRDQYRYYMGASKKGSALYFPTECNVLKYENNTFYPVKGLLELPYQITKVMPDSTMVFAGYAGLFQKKQNGEVISWSRDSVGVSSILNVELNNNNQLVAVGKNGVAIVSNNLIKRYQEDYNINSYSTAKDHKNNIWIGGMKNISLYNNDSIILVSQKKEEAFYSLLFVEPHYLFLGGIKGLYVANLDNYYKNGIFETLLFNQLSGFTGIECGQNGFFTDSEGMVWLPTSDLVTRFDPKKLVERGIKPPKIFLNWECSPDNIHWKKRDRKNSTTLKFDENNLRFKVDIISFANTENIRYYYQLKGLQNEWSDASEINEATFYNLKPGKYSMLVKADAGISTACSETIDFVFEIKKPFWVRWWFIIIEIIFVLFIVYSLIQFFRKREQQKTVTRQRLTQLRSEALSAQLDPHFVMNCLNNISGLVNAGYKQQANDYIVKFSKLLRVILQSVKKEAISLSAELEMVIKYMELEQFRCNNCFSYSIILPENCSTKIIMVPPMLLQPIVENSIKHGFGNTNSKNAKIEIRIGLLEQDLLFTISDNGKGIHSEKNTLGTGLGTKITKERIELLQKKNNIEFSIKNNKPGVKVSFKIPLVLYHKRVAP